MCLQLWCTGAVSMPTRATTHLQVHTHSLFSVSQQLHFAGHGIVDCCPCGLSWDFWGGLPVACTVLTHTRLSNKGYSRSLYLFHQELASENSCFSLQWFHDSIPGSRSGIIIKPVYSEIAKYVCSLSLDAGFFSSDRLHQRVLQILIHIVTRYRQLQRVTI